MTPRNLMVLAGTLFFAVVFNPSVVGAQVVYEASTQAELISEVKSVAAGKSFWLVLRLQPDPGWHTYWKNPGDSGLATTIKWVLPAGFQAGPIQWPSPEKILTPPLVGYGYSKEVFLFTEIYPPKNLIRIPKIDITAQVEWLACKVQCLPGKAEFNMTLPVLATPPEMNMAWALPFAQARSQLPRPSREWTVLAHDRGKEYEIAINPTAEVTIDSVYFFPERDDLINHAADQVLRKTEQGYILNIKKSNVNTKPGSSLQGVLVASPGWHGPRSFQALRIDVPVALVMATPTNKPASSVASASINLLVAIGFAFLGGLILNLMPCVLPVLSLKILNLVQQRREKSIAVWRHGLIFSFGILVAFWILAAALTILRGLGQQIGWGFQFQSPTFMILLVILFFVFSLNLFGVFEIGAGLSQLSAPLRSQQGEWGSFFSGLLATVVATPCTAPFMGTAIGFAITQPAPVIFLVFTALGIGLALPFFLLACFPNLLRFVPKSGPWMIRFKQVLGFVLLASVVWLIWVLSVQTGRSAVILLFVGLAFIGGSLGIYGQRLQKNKSAKSKRNVIVIAAILLLIGLAFCWLARARGPVAATPDAAVKSPSGRIVWQKYSPELVERLRAEGKAVFIDFTAAWCITCQVNERFALANSQVVQKFQELNVAALKADWTLRDSEITQALAAFQKNSIPLYVLYQKDKKDPVILPEIITPAIVLEALTKA